MNKDRIIVAIVLLATLLFGMGCLAVSTGKDFFFSLDSEWVNTRIESKYSPLPSIDD